MPRLRTYNLRRRRARARKKTQHRNGFFIAGAWGDYDLYYEHSKGVETWMCKLDPHEHNLTRGRFARFTRVDQKHPLRLVLNPVERAAAFTEIGAIVGHKWSFNVQNEDALGALATVEFRFEEFSDLMAVRLRMS